MSNIDRIHAATRDNTRKSYRAAIEHFEVSWGGFLPATADSITHYLADYADNLSINTLRQRLAGIAAWHQEQGFPDPTKAPYVNKKVLKGIAELHPTTPKQAKPIQLYHLRQLVSTLDQAIQGGTQIHALQAIRNKSLLLMGFWRAFRSDELARLCAEHVQSEPGSSVSYLGLLIQLKIVQRLGRFVSIKEIHKSIIEHIKKAVHSRSV